MMSRSWIPGQTFPGPKGDPPEERSLPPPSDDVAGGTRLESRLMSTLTPVLGRETWLPSPRRSDLDQVRIVDDDTRPIPRECCEAPNG